MEYKIEQLKKEDWQGYVLDFRYESDYYHDVEITRTNDDFSVTFIKKPFETPFVKAPDAKDALFQHWWDNTIAWGIVDDGKLLAVIETSVEVWSNRLRVNELWVHESLRRKGVARKLMDTAVQRAKDEKRRAILLETQSSNNAAVSFYLNYGFTLIGFDAFAYHNDDINRKEVRLEMGMYL